MENQKELKNLTGFHAVPKIQPKWFMGTKEEWALTRSVVNKSGWSFWNRWSLLPFERANLPGAGEVERQTAMRSENKWHARLCTDIGAGGMFIVGGAVGLFTALKTAAAAGWAIGDILMIPVAVLVLSFTGFMIGAGAGTISGLIVSNIIKPLWDKISGNSWETLLTKWEGIDKKRLTSFIRAADLAEKKLSGHESARKEAEEAKRVFYVLNKVLSDIGMKEEKKVWESRKDDLMEQLLIQIQKEMPEMISGVGETVSRHLTLESKLTALGEIGLDGVAAVSIWQSLKDCGSMDETERKATLSERIPRLVEAYEAVPEDARETPNELLNGETPAESLRKGLAAALAGAMSAKIRATERAAIKVSVEAQVLVESAPDFEMKTK